MSRRILAALLLLTAALFVGIVLPLGLNNARHDRVLFAFRAEVAAERYAAAAQVELAATGSVPGLTPDTLPVAHADELAGPDATVDDLAIHDLAGRVVAASGQAVSVNRDDLAKALGGETAVFWPQQAGVPKIMVVAPLRDDGQVVGALSMARSDSQLRYKINHRWINLAVGGAFAAVGAVLMASLLARWVSRPLRGLEAAATDLGAGQLSARARFVNGPLEVRQLATTFDEMASRIETLVGGQREFLADVSHQLRTPLTAMRLRLELLEADVTGTVAADVAGSLAELRRLSRLLDGLLAMSRAENAPPPSAAVDVAVVVELRTLAWQAVAQDAGAGLRCYDRSEGASMATVTPGHLEQVVDNLVANALEAVASGALVEIAVSRPSQATVRITVTDDGPGMSPEHRAGAFERFGAREPGQPADRRGTGLGLSIVHALVSSDGGTIELDEAPAGGLQVVVDVPAAPSRSVAGEDATVVPYQPSQTHHDRRSAVGVAPPSRAAPSQGAPSQGAQSQGAQ